MLNLRKIIWLYIGVLIVGIIFSLETWHSQQKISPQFQVQEISDSAQKIIAKIDTQIVAFQTSYEKIAIKKAIFRQDSTKKTILLTGDSMGDGLFMRLLQLKKYNAWQVIYKPWYGSTTRQWASSQRLSEHIATYKPQIVIFTLGSNELFVPVNDKKVADVRNIIKQSENVSFLWVGPPNWKKDWGLDSMLQAEVGEKYFVSKNMILARKNDGAHPTLEAAKIWWDSIAQWVNQNPKYDFYFQLQETL